jgi:hypothetical protein
MRKPTNDSLKSGSQFHRGVKVFVLYGDRDCLCLEKYVNIIGMKGGLLFIPVSPLPREGCD